MAADQPQPTAYPDVNVVLELLRTNVQRILGEHFVGFYLYGSLASGDFDPQSSDIDFMMVTATELPDELIPALATMHAQLATSGLPWAKKLEGSYIPQRALRRYEPTGPPRVQINEGNFYLAPHASDWIIQRQILREQGVVVTGPDLRLLIDPVQPHDVRQAVLDILAEWWAPMRQNSTRLQSREYQAYAVLSMCRALYTLHHGSVASKPSSARWAQAALDPRWVALIEEALAWPHPPQVDSHDATLAFIGYTLARAQEFQFPKRAD